MRPRARTTTLHPLLTTRQGTQPSIILRLIRALRRAAWWAWDRLLDYDQIEDMAWVWETLKQHPSQERRHR